MDESQVPDASLGGGKESSADLPEIANENEEKERSTVTKWREVRVSSIMIYFLITIKQSLYVGGWAYMLKLDKDTPIEFAALMACSHHGGHAIGTAIFATVTFASQNFRRSLFAGRILSTAGCVLYLNIEFFSITLRRYVFLFSFFLNGLGEGSSCLLRSYIPRVSTSEDRQKACSVLNGAQMLAVISGPLAQVVLTSLGKDGVSLGVEQLRLSLYTGSIWLSLLLNLIAFYVCLFRFREPPPIEQAQEGTSMLSTMKSTLKQIAALDRFLIVVCIVEKSIGCMGFVAIVVMLSPYMIAIYNVGKEKTVEILAIGQGICGLLSLATVALFVFTPIGKKLKSSLLFPIALACFLLVFAGSYPLLPFTGAPIVVMNDTFSPNGCNVTTFTWCAHESVVHLYLWLPLVIALLGVSIPTSFIAFDTIFSRILTGIDQNLMQGAVAIVEDFTSVLAPLVAMEAFTAVGPLFWNIFAGAMLAGLLLWIPVFSRLRKLQL